MYIGELCVLGFWTALSIIVSMGCLIVAVCYSKKNKIEIKKRREAERENQFLRRQVFRLEMRENIRVANEFNDEIKKEGTNK